MAIAVQCPSCSSAFRVKDEMAGKRGKCPRCAGIIQVPANGSPSQAGSAATASASTVSNAGSSVGPGKSTPQNDGVCVVGSLKGGPAESAANQGAFGIPTPPQLPHGHDPWASARTPQRQLEILAGLDTPIARVRTTMGYRLALILVSLVMILLPLLYVAFVALVGLGIFWHATNSVGILSASGGGARGAFVRVLLYVGPLIIGSVILIFLTKPLFARPVRFERRRSLTRDGEPLLFEFVNRLCKSVGAPTPTRIDVDLEVNASAGFRNGIRSLFSRDLVLTIGLPLVAGLSLRQFAGVLAHEFGHFAQGAGMRATYLIMSINNWFARVVYERDEWDQRLEMWAQYENFWIMGVAQLSRAGVWCGRRVLQVLMYIGVAVGGAMLRQMEYDADLNEIRLAGSRTFEITCRRLPLISVSTNAAFHDLEGYFKDGKLADNLPALIILNLPMVPLEIRRKIDELTANATTGIFDTHPCPRERISFAKRQNEEGTFHVEGPASELFRDFRALARNCTWDVYRGIFGARLKLTDLCPVDELIAAGPPGSTNFDNAPIPLAGDAPIPLAD